MATPKEIRKQKRIYRRAKRIYHKEGRTLGEMTGRKPKPKKK